MAVRLTLLPALDIGAQALAFLDFLIREPVRSALLHEAGVAVVVPAPNRFAVHKLIVAGSLLWSQLAKSTKDVDQAAALIDAFEATGRQFELREAFEEAWSRGPAWRSALRAGLSRLPPRTTGKSPRASCRGQRPMTSDEKPGSSILDATNETSSLPARLEPLAEAARGYARAATSTNTNRAYGADWRHYIAWAAGKTSRPCPRTLRCRALYRRQASGAAAPSRSGQTIERRLSALMWNFAQRGPPMDRKDRHIATVLAGVRRTQARPPQQKEAVLAM